MIVGGLLAGGGIGLGMTWILRGLFAPPRPLAEALDQLHRPAAQSPAEVPGRGTRAAQAVNRALSKLGVDLRATRSDLRIVGRPIERHLLDKLLTAIAGLALPPVMALLATVSGVPVSPLPVTTAAFVLAVVGFVLPDTLLATQAREARRAFAFALSSYLDLVQIVLAAGTGVETALLDAADAGTSRPFRQLRAALDRARLAGDSPWNAFRQVGDELDVSELRELASALALAGTHGAKVRASLAARAEAARQRDLAETEARAEAATERMSVPTAVLTVAFIVFILFPAAYEIIGF